MWSFGITMIELFHRCPPFYNKLDLWILVNTAMLYDPTQHIANQEINPQLNDLIHRMLKINAAERIDAASVLQHPFTARRANRQEMIALAQRVFTNNNLVESIPFL